jgi:peptide/nickel transport system permease protein
MRRPVGSARRDDGGGYSETVFTRPGTGYLLNKAVLTRDIPLLQGTMLVLATAFVLINLVVDLIQSLTDPRLKRS